jgi:capsular polysaccharide export protein
MGLRLPVLRSPDFPGVDRDEAAISRPRPAVAGMDAVTPFDPQRIQLLIALLVQGRVGGAFWASPVSIAKSVTAILKPADADQAERMALAALTRCQAEAILVALPAADWAAPVRRKLAERGIAVVQGEFDSWSLIAASAVLHVDGDDELALLGLIAGCRVHCYADGRFAGRGLTVDDPAIRPKPAASIESLTAATLIDRVDYRDPFTGAAITAEAAAEHLIFWRTTMEANRGVAAAAGIATWKRREVEGMLHAGDRPLRFVPNAAAAVQAAVTGGGGIAVWPSRAPAGLIQTAADAGVPLYRVEDGFVRSVGLGAACHPPLSIVLDRTGLYYDPTGPSDLETILSTANFSDELRDRAGALAAFIVRFGISKYATGRGDAADLPAGVRRVLVTGQVEDDLSVRLGGGDVTGNLDLLRRVRAAEPDAFILFKPHPDVEAGLRAGHVSETDALAYADRVVRHTGMAELLDAVDCVHVLTSLAGFEALLRGREVVTHGHPFYAGWGLTRDMAGPVPRRTRRLMLTDLVAGALILYPRYLDPVTRLPCPPEILMARLSEQTRPRSTWLTRVRDMQGRLRRPSRRARSAA